MIDIENVIIINLLVEGQEEIIQNLRTLLTTPAGTVAFDRDFGIDTSFIDMPIEAAKARITSEYVQKINKYENRVKVSEITFETKDNILIPKVVIE